MSPDSLPFLFLVSARGSDLTGAAGLLVAAAGGSAGRMVDGGRGGPSGTAEEPTQKRSATRRRSVSIPTERARTASSTWRGTCGSGRAASPGPTPTSLTMAGKTRMPKAPGAGVAARGATRWCRTRLPERSCAVFCLLVADLESSRGAIAPTGVRVRSFPPRLPERPARQARPRKVAAFAHEPEKALPHVTPR